MKNNLEKEVIISHIDETIQELIEKISKSKTKIFAFCCVVDKSFQLLGVLNSGDILRGLSRNNNISQKVSELMNINPITVNEDFTRSSLLEEVSEKLILKTSGEKKFTRFVPVINKNGILIDVLDLYEFIGINPISKPSVAIYGLGYVGLTLATALSSVGIKVIGIDKNEKIINDLSKGQVHIYEPRLKDMIKNSLKNKTLLFQSFKFVPKSDFHIITVGTPVNKQNNPTIDDLKAVARTISLNMKPNSTIILRSTVPVGTTRDIVLPILQKSNLKIGENFFLSFCPERTVEGNAIQELFDIPQVIGGITEKCVEKSSFLFNFLTKSTVRAESVEASEFVKLLNNSFRDLSFAFSNAFVKVAENFNLDANTIISSANKGYPRNQIPLASPGVGGYCLTKDPYLYSNKYSHLYHSDLSKLGRRINSDTHNIVIRYIKKFILKNRLVKSNLKVLIVGMAFKGSPETNDLRGSTSVDLYRDLNKLKLETFCFDNVISSSDLAKSGFKVFENEINFKEIDIFLFMNNHPKNLLSNFFQKIHKNKPILFFDGWNLLKRSEIEMNYNWTYCSLGYFTK